MTKINRDKIYRTLQTVGVQLKKLGVAYYEYYVGVNVNVSEPPTPLKPSDIKVGMRLGCIRKGKTLYVEIVTEVTHDTLRDLGKEIAFGKCGEDNFVFVSGDKHLIVLR